MKRLFVAAKFDELLTSITRRGVELGQIILEGGKMGNAISSCFGKYATFSGRATRSEFWFFYLFYMIIYVLGAVISAVLGSQYLVYLFILPLFIPLLAAAVRRMHDVGRSGWFYLVPIYNIVLLCTASSPGSNKYGD